VKDGTNASSETASHFTLLDALWSDSEVESIWSREACLRAWLRVEGELARAQAQHGVIDAANGKEIAKVCADINIDAPRFWQETRTVGYPILPLITQLSEALPRAAAGQVHYGATTQDIMDSALALQLVATADRFEALLVEFGDHLSALCEQYKATPMAGRTHAQQAVPTTFGAKIAIFLEQIREELAVLRRARAEVGVVSLFGAGGTGAAMGPSSGLVRTTLATRLGLADAEIPWHVARGNILRFGQSLNSIAAVCVRFAREIVDLSRTEIGEVHERGEHHRGASSTMPQKANPISCEAIIGFGISASAVATGLTRAMEAGHERASGEWQIEWFTLPTLAQLSASALGLAIDTARGLTVYPDRMELNLALDFGLVLSEAMMMRLAPILGRDRAHDLVYEAAVQSRKRGISLLETTRELVPADGQSVLVEFSAGSYLGDASEIAEAAIARWKGERVIDSQSTRTHEIL
jgi:3-carboxy-cis,cis-muconate cycloisomerase